MDEIGAGLDRLKAFNRMVAGHPVLSARLIHGEHDFLQWQQGLLFASFRRYAKRPVEAQRAAETGGKTTLGLVVARVVAVTMTLWTLARGRREIVIFSVDKVSAEGDHDFRIDGLYRWLRGKGMGFAEVFHAQLGKTSLAYAWSRGRAAAYHEAFELFAGFALGREAAAAEARGIAAGLACGEFEEADRPFARALAEKSLRAAAVSKRKVRWYRRFLRRLAPRMILSIDDTRYYHELCVAARSLGIPFYAFQHGLFTVSHVGWLDHGYGSSEKKTRPDKLVVWSEYWKRELLRLGTYFKEDELLIGGNPKGEPPPAPPAPVEDGIFGVLIPYESGAPKEEAGAFIRRFLEDPSVRIFFSVRPDRDAAKQMSEYGLEASERLTIVSGDLDARLPNIHAVCGAYSTFLYDALAFRRPVVILETSRTTGRAMVENGLAESLPRGAASAELKDVVRNANARVEARAREYLGGGVTLKETLVDLLKR